VNSVESHGGAQLGIVAASADSEALCLAGSSSLRMHGAPNSLELSEKPLGTVKDIVPVQTPAAI
jgi:hypothetical protein